ncbi:MAG: hypothetical protein ACOY4Q_08385 [Bacillota bacterium]
MADKKEKGYKRPVPKEFVPTELGSAIQASVAGRPVDKELLIDDNHTEKITGNPGERQPE